MCFGLGCHWEKQSGPDTGECTINKGPGFKCPYQEEEGEEDEKEKND